MPEAPGLVGCREVDLHGPPEAILGAARALLGDAAPAAVVALAERTVLAAAHLRDRFGLAGNGPPVALRCADKVEMKRAMDAAGVPVCPWREVHRDTRARELVAALGLPLVLKPRRDSGGRGQRRFVAEAALEAELAALQAGGGFDEGYGWLAERWLEGIEMSVEAFLHQGELRFQSFTEYFVPRHANIVPAELDAGAERELRAFHARALAAAGVERGITHLELFRTAAGPVFGELAIRPPGGRIMTLLRRGWGFDPWEALLRLSLGEDLSFPQAPRCCAGVWILHPGSGTVAAIHGLDEARAVPNLRRIALKVGVGQRIPERLGTGQDVGSLYAEGPDRDHVAAALTSAREHLRFEFA